MPFTPLSAVATAVYGALNVAALTSLAPGGVHDDVPQDASFPFVLVEVSEEAQHGGFGTRSGQGALPEVRIRAHVYSTYEGRRQQQVIVDKVIELLQTPPAVSGYSAWEIFHDQTIPMEDDLVAGVKVKELMATFRLYVEHQ